MPAAGLPWLARDDVLTFEEIVRVTRILVDQCGVRTIRLTGGEPLVRKGIEDLTAMIAGIDGELDIAMTTNGILLEEKAVALRAAGLKRLNVSLDTLHSDRFKDLARRDALDRVLRGLAAARTAGFNPIKLNMVVMRGRNDDEILDFARLARPDGHLRTCLFSIQEHDVKALLRGGASDVEIRDFVAAAVWQKEEGHKIGQADFVRPGKTMSQIGG